MLKEMHQLSIIAILEPFSDTTHIQSCMNQLAMEYATHFTITFVYAKCNDHLRRPLWDRLLHHAASNTNPWCSVSDYNIITSIVEKLGGLPYNIRTSLEFTDVIEACGLLDLGFSGQNFTWSSKRGTDHYPLLMEMTTREEDHIRPIEGNNMWRFHQKLKRLSNTLSSWSMGGFGDIFIKLKEYEERVRATEENLIHDHNEINRTTIHELNAEYIRFLKLEDSILKQKTQLH
ncbi:hypothetical protein MTR67_039024 [Solanum verrucosum]|uniref:Endonuclease/exonuclease/phosphatase domain-containing protein n=1 Tax=Solanum verrucosum TaxID=315347 RepID=A0AAF0UGW4_SOLVR|nr:hypothetical protein MTR67_039024 [Solanum verrucosum]